MTDLPSRVTIKEEGPREGFQIEKGPFTAADKIAVVDALSGTGLKFIQVGSFVAPRLVPGWADAEEVMAGFTPTPGVEYAGLWFNEAGLERALKFRGKLTLKGSISLAASDAFSKKNLNRTHAENLAAMPARIFAHQAADVAVTRIGVMAAFGCNFQGDITPAQVLSTIADGLAVARDTGCTITDIMVADTMGWATPARVERVIGAVRNAQPSMRLTLHLHDTRGLGIANAHAGLRMGVDSFDTSVAGLGGCPFAAQPGAPGNIATEELALLCEEMGIATGIDIDALIEAARLAERIIGRPLPSTLLRSGGLGPLRARAA